MKCQSGNTELLSHQETTRVTQYFNFVAIQYYLMYIFLSQFWVSKTCPFRLRNVYERTNSLDFLGYTDGTVVRCRSTVRTQLDGTRAYSLRVKPVFGIFIRHRHFCRLITY
jgi:hypothetical protein